MRVHVQLINKGIEQHFTTEEPIQDGFDVQNALGHAGIVYGEVTWGDKRQYIGLTGVKKQVMSGMLKDSDAIVVVVTED